MWGDLRVHEIVDEMTTGDGMTNAYLKGALKTDETALRTRIAIGRQGIAASAKGDTETAAENAICQIAMDMIGGRTETTIVITNPAIAEDTVDHQNAILAHPGEIAITSQDHVQRVPRELNPTKRPPHLSQTRMPLLV